MAGKALDTPGHDRVASRVRIVLSEGSAASMAVSRMRGSLVLIVIGVVIVAVQCVLVPLLDRLFPNTPKWFAGDPVAMRTFRSRHRRQSLLAGAVIIAVGLLTVLFR